MNLVSILFLVLAAIHILPGVVGLVPSQLQNLYGVPPEDKTLTTLLQHRAVLLGLVGATFSAAAFLPQLRWAALIGGGASMILFLVIAGFNQELAGPLKKIAIVDGVGLLILPVIAYLLDKGH